MRHISENPGLIRWLTAATWVGLAVTPASWAFHEQGVANCNGCHVIHDSQGGMPPAPGAFGEAQLLAPSPTEVCLMCHEGTLGSDPLNPPDEKGAGNFVFLLEDDINDASDAMTPILGDAAGHNLVAPGLGLQADPRYSVSPGGTFPSSELGCTACHDPHGNGNFRMLNGRGPVAGGLTMFTRPAPDAIGVDSRTGREAPNSHTAYRSGMSEWCGNCHGSYHEEGSVAFDHPVQRALSADERNQYNRYDGDDNPTGGLQPLAYLPEVPFEHPTTSVDSTAGPDPGARVMCASCHRAHATSAPAALRWDPNVTLLIEDGLRSGSYPIPDPYRSPNQGSLCRKCHTTIPD